MSEVEVHYLISPKDRMLDDAETVTNAIGAYQNEQPDLLGRTYEYAPYTQPSGNMLLVLNQTTADKRYDHDLREAAERMRNGIERHFPEKDRARLSSHFSGIALKDELFTE